LLVVEDDALARRALVRMLRERDVVAVADAREASAALESTTFGGLISDLKLDEDPQGGFHIAVAFRARFPIAPIAIATAGCEPWAVNRTAALGATFVAKPFGMAALEPFLDRVSAASLGIGHLSAAISSRADAWDVHGRVRELLAYLVAGADEESILARTGYGHATYKTYVNKLLKAANCARTSDVVTIVLRAATHAELELQTCTGSSVAGAVDASGPHHRMRP